MQFNGSSMAEPLLAYSDSEDQVQYADCLVELGSGDRHVASLSAATVAGDPEHPNEDAYAIAAENGALYLGVFDGLTSLQAVEGLTKETGGRFASHEIRDVFAHAVAAQEPREILLHCNEHLRAASAQIPGVSAHEPLTLPSTGATMVRVDWDENKLHLGHITDGYCVVWYRDGSSDLITENTNAEFDQGLFEYLAQYAQQRGISNREAQQLPEVRAKWREVNARKLNKPDGLGSGALSGDDYAEIYIQTESFSLESVRSILVASDGFALIGGDITDIDYRYLLGKELRHGRLAEFIDRKKAAENADPDWEQARYKHSDDATAILLEL